MTDWKTTISGIVAAAAQLLKLFKIAEVPTDVLDGITAVAVFCIGFFSKDSTGGTQK